MKGYVKGIITGILIGIILCSLPAMADTIDALFNSVRININGVDTIQWGENIKLANGAQTPSSIMYNDTTYLPMRKLAELFGNKIYWNGDSDTVSMTGAQKDIKTLAEKTDKNGNVWEYYTFKDDKDKCYLGVKDKARDFERIYLMPSESVNVTDNEIYFVRLQSENEHQYTNFADLIKLPFENSPDNQDGEIITTLKANLPTNSEINASVIGDNVFFDSEYLYYAFRIQGNSFGHDGICAYNYMKGSRTEMGLDHYSRLKNVELTESNPQSALFKYTVSHGDTVDCEAIFDKTKNTFIEKSINEVE